ncbi:MAG: hypothetical protein BWZ02_02397 [Lentisphaerae bacterium ADurb.BinA184]|nr:MAG: hypothetical protein BWZ02_02397 [Lentisphaerae bacterium ADurb.BinA184]
MGQNPGDNSNANRRTRRATRPACLGGLALLAVLTLPLTPGCSRDPAPPTPAPDVTAPEEWLRAVAAGRADDAVRLATAILGDNGAVNDIPSVYAELFRANGLSPAFIGAAFEPRDAAVWADALFFLDLAGRPSSGPEEAESLFSRVTGRLQPAAPANDRNLPWPRQTWQEAAGYCDRQAWVLCELAWQAGFETMIYYLMDPATRKSPHTICELRKDGRVWTADPFSRRMLADVSIAQLADDDGRLEAFWPERADWRQAIRHGVYLTPALAQDYCPRNQRLHAALRPALRGRCPRFGEAPAGRARRYADLMRAAEPQRWHDTDPPIRLWDFPLRLLVAADARAAQPVPPPAASR